MMSKGQEDSSGRKCRMKIKEVTMKMNLGEGQRVCHECDQQISTKGL